MTSDQAPAPLTPADCDLQDFAFMPLHVARLRDSELASNEVPEACWAAVLLWAASWHQVPAASIPDDDRWMAKQAGYGRVVSEWARVRDGALRGWIKCSDGRLYHPVVAEAAIDSWAKKVDYAYGKMAERLRKSNKGRTEKGLPVIPVPSKDVWISGGKADPLPPEAETQHPIHPPELPPPSAGIPTENALKGEGQGEGQGESSVPDGTGGEPPPAAKLPPDPVKQEIWDAGRSMLLAARTPPKQVGSFLAKLVQDYTADVVLLAIRAAVAEQPADPLTWLVACCRRTTGQRRAPMAARTESFFADDEPPTTTTFGDPHAKPANPRPADVIDIDSRRIG